MRGKKEVGQVRRKYSVEFKQQAIERAEKEGVPRTAELLGLAKAQLYAWKKQTRSKSKTEEDQLQLEAENSRLKRENQRLEEELAFLKKCAVYFAKIPK
jgi:transposase